MTTVGLIGLGAMGSGMAGSLRRAGHSVQVFDVRREVAEAFTNAGGTAHDSLASLGAACDVVVSVVVNAAQTEDVLFGAHGLATSMAPGSVIVCSATVDPAVVPGWAERLASHGLLLIDGPVSGGARKAEAGEMTVMASGEARAFEAGLELLQACAGKVYRLGERPGIGSTVKMVNQHLAGVHIATACEAMALGMRAGADPAQLDPGPLGRGRAQEAAHPELEGERLVQGPDLPDRPLYYDVGTGTPR
jgi:3-hydroxyisobutyrate dehydrogenase